MRGQLWLFYLLLLACGVIGQAGGEMWTGCWGRLCCWLRARPVLLGSDRGNLTKWSTIISTKLMSPSDLSILLIFTLVTLTCNLQASTHSISIMCIFMGFHSHIFWFILDSISMLVFILHQMVLSFNMVQLAWISLRINLSISLWNHVSIADLFISLITAVVLYLLPDVCESCWYLCRCYLSLCCELWILQDILPDRNFRGGVFAVFRDVLRQQVKLWSCLSSFKMCHWLDYGRSCDPGTRF